jgi:glycosyltransferase involved in cell wall biosynthesis
LRGLPNVRFVEYLPRAEITRVIAGADVCLIPHVRNELTAAMSPLKLFEYLAAGRPVASVDLPPIAAVAGHGVVLVGEEEEFVPAVRRALELGPATEEQRLAFVRENAWSGRFERLLELALAEP